LRSTVTGATGSAVMAVSSPQVVYSARARGYSLLVLGAIASFWLLLRAVGAGRARHWAAYAAVMVLTIYAHLWGLLLLPAHAVLVALAALRAVRSEDRPEFGTVAWRALLVRFGVAGTGVLAIVVGLYAPMLRGIVDMLGEPKVTAVGPELAAAVAWNLDLGLPEATWTFWPLAGLAVAGAAWFGRLHRDPAIALGIAVVAGALLIVAVVQPANFYPRFLIFLVPSLLIVTARAVAWYPALGGGADPANRRCAAPNWVSRTVAAIGALLVAGGLSGLALAYAGGTLADSRLAAGLPGWFIWTGSAALIASFLWGGVDGPLRLVHRATLVAAICFASLDVAVSQSLATLWIELAWLGAIGLAACTAAEVATRQRVSRR
ncbi:MAG: hypothetical protein ACOC46_02565, partial [Pirellulales bacterium]